MANGLSAKQEAFVYAYLGEARFNATKAAKLAGYSERSAYSQAHELLKNPEISARVKAELEQRAMPAEAVLAELTDVATAEWRDFVEIVMNDDDGEPLKVRFDLRSKVHALELLGKHHKLFTEKIEHGATEDFVAALRAFGGGDGRGA